MSPSYYLPSRSLVAAIIVTLLNLHVAPPTYAFAPASVSLISARVERYTSQSQRCMSKDDCDDWCRKSDDSMVENVESSSPKIPPNRRQAIRSAVSAAATVLAAPTIEANRAEAIEVPVPNFLLPQSRQSIDGGAYRQARRATAYLVDSTIPPTLVPFRASREAAVLKQLGQSSGTSKEPFVEERINLNNIAQKSIFGTVDAIKSLAGSDGAGRDGSKKDATFVFLGVDYASGEDAELAAGLLTDIIKPRQRGEATALGLAFAPLSTQGALDAYARGGADETSLIDALSGAGVDRTAIDNYLPLIQFARSKKLALLALSPEAEDLAVVRKEGLQDVNIERRKQYVADADGFIALTQDPKYKLYAEKSLFKDFVPKSDKDKPGDFFAERILVHEAIATAASKWAMSRPDSLVAVVAPIQDVRFMGGPNGRVPRVCKFVNPLANVDEEAVTTILLNPSAEETLSASNFLRLEIGTTPKTLQYQTKVADYLWFSRMPKVNVLPRMMNYR